MKPKEKTIIGEENREGYDGNQGRKKSSKKMWMGMLMTIIILKNLEIGEYKVLDRVRAWNSRSIPVVII